MTLLKPIKNLAKKQCKPCRADEPVMAADKVKDFLSVLKDWQLDDTKQQISRRFSFKNFDQTMSFINKLAKVAEKNDHHPDASFGYNYCLVVYSTHSIGGLSENDFICAAQLEEQFIQI